MAARLGGSTGDALRSAAREAFVHGMHVTLLVSAALLLLGALAALRLPRTMETGREEAVQDEAARDEAVREEAEEAPARVKQTEAPTAATSSAVSTGKGRRTAASDGLPRQPDRKRGRPETAAPTQRGKGDEDLLSSGITRS